MAKITPLLESWLPFQHQSQNSRITRFKPLPKMMTQNWKTRQAAVNQSGGPIIQNPETLKLARALNNQLRIWMMKPIALNHDHLWMRRRSWGCTIHWWTSWGRQCRATTTLSCSSSSPRVWQLNDRMTSPMKQKALNRDGFFPSDMSLLPQSTKMIRKMMSHLGQQALSLEDPSQCISSTLRYMNPSKRVRKWRLIARHHWGGFDAWRKIGIWRIRRLIRAYAYEQTYWHRCEPGKFHFRNI